MNYQEATTARVSLREVEAELGRHGLTLKQARTEGLTLRLGKDGLYSGGAVLRFLGY